MAISTNGTIITRLAGALYGEYLSNASYTELNTTAAATVAANMLANDFAGKTDAQIATIVLTNLSLNTVAGLDNWVAAQLTAAGSAKGAKLVSMLNDYAMMTADATYGASATSFNTKVAASLVLSQTTGNAGGTFASAGTAPTSGGTFTLTTGADLAGTSSASNAGLATSFRFTGGNETITADIGTLSGSDTLIDGSSTDADVLNVSLTGASGTVVSSKVETISAQYVAGSPDLDLTNVYGANTITVSGSVAGTVSELDASVKQPVIGIENFGRVLTINAEQLTGTALAGTAETINVSVSGATYGTTAATRSGITLTADTGAGTLETLNITSAGAAANTFTLDASTNVALSTVNLLGGKDLTVRVDHDDITGVTVVGTASTGVTNVRINRESDTTTATNLANFTGVGVITVADDATTPAAALVLASAKAGQKFVVVDDMATGGSITFQGASTSALASSTTLVLDNDTANTDTDIGGTLDIQNVTAITIESLGYATSSTSADAENALTLGGDFSTVTITGDTSVDMTLAMEGAGALGTTSRAVTVTAAGMTGTAYVELDVSGDTYNTYTITGTANADVLAGSTTAITLNGGDGNDSLTGGSANDVINGGAGNDTVTTTAGTDTVTFGDGTDTLVIASTAAVTAAVQETQNILFASGGVSGVATTWIIRVLGEDILWTSDTSPIASEFESGVTAAINSSVAARAGRVSASDGTGVDLTFAATEGNASTSTVRVFGQSTSDTATTSVASSGSVGITTGTAGSLGDLVDVVSSDFSTTDLISIANLTLASSSYFEGAIGDAVQATEYGIMVLTNVSYATIAEAETAIEARLTDGSDADMIVVFMNSTLGYAEVFYDSDIDTDGAATTNSILKLTGVTTLTQLADTFATTDFVS